MSKVRNAKLEMESYQRLMKESKNRKEYAMYKHDFRAARNRYHKFLQDLRDSFKSGQIIPKPVEKMLESERKTKQIRRIQRMGVNMEGKIEIPK